MSGLVRFVDRWMWLFEHCRRHRINRWQEISDQLPVIPSIPAGKELTGIGAHIHPAWILNIGTHRVSQDTQQHTGTFRQSLRERLPLLPAILGTVHSELLANVIPCCRVLDHDIQRIGMVHIQSDRKAEFGGQILLDISPVITCVRTLVDATMVLLVQYIWLRWVLHKPVDALAKLWILFRQEAG